jgi:hypothetical protein
MCSELNETCILSIPAVNSLNDVLNRKLTQKSQASSESLDVVTNVLNSYVVTQSRAKCLPVSSDANDTSSIDEGLADESVDQNGNDGFVDVDVASSPNVISGFGDVNARDFALEQKHDETLAPVWKLARLSKVGYIVKDGLL